MKLHGTCRGTDPKSRHRLIIELDLYEVAHRLLHPQRLEGLTCTIDFSEEGAETREEVFRVEFRDAGDYYIATNSIRVAGDTTIDEAMRLTEDDAICYGLLQFPDGKYHWDLLDCAAARVNELGFDEFDARFIIARQMK